MGSSCRYYSTRPWQVVIYFTYIGNARCNHTSTSRNVSMSVGTRSSAVLVSLTIYVTTFITLIHPLRGATFDGYQHHHQDRLLAFSWTPPNLSIILHTSRQESNAKRANERTLVEPNQHASMIIWISIRIYYR